jgi:hypothetical protein
VHLFFVRVVAEVPVVAATLVELAVRAVALLVGAMALVQMPLQTLAAEGAVDMAQIRAATVEVV